jgi:elongation factor P
MILFKQEESMISTSDFKTGLTVEIDGNVWCIVEFLHVKPGKGSAFVRTKLKNVESGNVMEKTFRAGEKMPRAIVEKGDMQYLYAAGESEFIFMDTQTFDQLTLTKEQLGDSLKYLKENMVIQILRYQNRIIGLDLPNFVELEVTDTPPSEKGDTAQGGTKPAILETGASVNVPFFVKNGDVIRVDTRTNSYLDRV